MGGERTALVTGGAGFIGSHLVRRLIADGLLVRIIDDLSTGKLENLSPVMPQVEFIRGDICDFDQLRQAMGGVDQVFHLAAVASVPRTVKEPLRSAEVNELGTLKVLEAARQAGVRRVVMASSSAVYGDEPGFPKDESMTGRPLSPYAWHKRSGEIHGLLYQELYGLDTVSMRFFNVFGPRQDPSSPYSGVISIFMSRAQSGAPPDHIRRRRAGEGFHLCQRHSAGFGAGHEHSPGRGRHRERGHRKADHGEPAGPGGGPGLRTEAFHRVRPGPGRRYPDLLL